MLRAWAWLRNGRPSAPMPNTRIGNSTCSRGSGFSDMRVDSDSNATEGSQTASIKSYISAQQGAFVTRVCFPSGVEGARRSSLAGQIPEGDNLNPVRRQQITG